MLLDVAVCTGETDFLIIEINVAALVAKISVALVTIVQYFAVFTKAIVALVAMFHTTFASFNTTLTRQLPTHSARCSCVDTCFTKGASV